jgi:hypothetical protein
MFDYRVIEKLETGLVEVNQSGRVEKWYGMKVVFSGVE